MFVPEMFQGGGSPLPPHERSLDVLAMDRFHVSACSCCSDAGFVVNSCYWSQMRLPIEEGWTPHIDVNNIHEVYSASGPDGNHKSATIFSNTVTKEIAAQIKAGICTSFPAAPSNVIISPLGVVIKASDIAKGKVFTGITITDQHSLDAVNASLLQQGLPLTKGRPINDVTATGVNAALLTPPFANSGIEDAIALIYPNCVMGKLDISRYFHQFPLAPSSKWLFWFQFGLIFYRMNSLIFGAGPSPYFTSAYGAEFRKWMLHAFIPVVHFCDDYLTVGDHNNHANHRLDLIAAFLIAIGFIMADDKKDFGQRLVYLGVLFDSVKMVLSFDPLAASSFHSELESALAAIKRGRHLSVGEIRHIAGKLSHFSQVCQSGRLHIRYWWAYFHHGPSLSPSGLDALFRDSDWWLQQ